MLVDDYLNSLRRVAVVLAVTFVILCLKHAFLNFELNNDVVLQELLSDVKITYDS